MYRPRSWSDCAVPAHSHGDKSLRLWNLQQGIPTGPEPTVAPTRAQPTMETEAAEQQRRLTQEGVHLPRDQLCAPWPSTGTRRPYRDQETLQPQARGEEVEMREVLQEVCGSVRLEGAFKDLWHQGIPLWLRHPLLKVWFSLKLKFVLWLCMHISFIWYFELMQSCRCGICASLFIEL